MTQNSLLPALPEVKGKKEKTGRRDIKLCERHRLWGLELNQCDLDFLEYSSDGTPVLLVEYKLSFHLRDENLPQNDRRLKAITLLANNSAIPGFLTYYNPDFQYWRPLALNSLAHAYEPVDIVSEMKYVELLYKIRGFAVIPSAILREIKPRLNGGGF